MVHLPLLYCQLGFIEKFFKSCEPSLMDLLLKKESDIEVITACFNLLFGPSRIYIDATPEEIINHPNPLISKMLLKNPTASLRCINDFEERTKSKQFWNNLTTELFLMEISSDKAYELEQDWGILVLTPENLRNKGKRLLSSSPIFVKKKETVFSWEYFEESRHFFHTILIADNYLDADENKLKLNLLPLIKSISSGSPRKRKTHLTVLTTTDNIKLLHQKLSTLLSDAGLDFDIRVVKTNRDNNHDRNLVTNQRWISSGYGFNLLKWDASKKCSVAEKSTTVLSMPLLSNGTIKYIEEQKNTMLTTYFGTAMGIIEMLEKIDREMPETIGTETKTIGSLNPKPLTKA